MKNLLFFLILLSTFCFSQQASIKEYSGIYPLYTVDGMVSNESQMKLINSNSISSVSIYKSDNLPDNLNVFSNFASEGIIEIILKEKNHNLVSVSLERLNATNHLDELNPVYINRILVKSTSVKIIEDAILETEIIENNGQRYLNIWTMTQEERAGIAKRTGGIKISPKDNSTIKNIILK